ncbi:flagellar biosynthesis anti-sigma factor FlgM [Pandoraea sputorum]|nr:flagellar biosynthesis anti-sigma factor FlgM [Pandoraea sputorum]
MNRKRLLRVTTAAEASEQCALRDALASTGTAGIDVAKVAAIRAAIAKNLSVNYVDAQRHLAEGDDGGGKMV